MEEIAPDEKPYHDPVRLIRWTKKDGTFLYTDDECLRLIDVYINRRVTAILARKTIGKREVKR
jgi:hypothetical protein